MSDDRWPPAEALDHRASDHLLLRSLDLGRLLASANRGELRATQAAMPPEYRDAIYAWAVMACEQARWHDAREALVHLAADEPDSTRRLRACLAVETALSRWDAARELAQRLARVDPADAEVRFLLGQALWHLGRTDDALAAIRMAQRLSREDLASGARVAAWCEAWFDDPGEAPTGGLG